MRLGLTHDRGPGPFALLGTVTGGTTIVIAISIAVLIWVWAAGGRSESLLVNVGITAIMVIGYQVFVGNTGIVSFGHPAFVAIGAYVGGLVAVPSGIKSAILPDLPHWLMNLSVGFYPSILIGGAAAGLAALVVGPIVMRLSGATAGIMTFGLLVITNEVIRNLDQFTRGTQTFFGVPKASGLLDVYGLLCALTAVSLAYKFSRFGLRTRAARDDPLAAETSGINVVRTRVGAWVLSASITGVAGVLLAHQLTAFSPQSFFITMVIPVMVMAVLGGTASIIGGVAGVVVISAWLEFMRGIEGGSLFGLVEIPSIFGISQLTLGVGLILVLRLRPRGIFGSTEFAWRLSGSRPRDRDPDRGATQGQGE
ncbi:MAG: branched-chain amino acid ABC transporter permease [Rhodospirillaceae bacterium]|nr:branched-chain amino acid ABC transporter permease [Rhodospirillaceae bacterium]MDE0619488.1 branched-chain amino acid ABC transporter permease [Rhodospirillaceae bacterium]